MARAKRLRAQCSHCGKRNPDRAEYRTWHVYPPSGYAFCSEECELADIETRARREHTRRQDPVRFTGLHRHLRARVQAAPEDLQVIAEALEDAVAHLQLRDRYWTAFAAYTETGRADLRAKRAARALFGEREDMDATLARDYKMLLAAGGLPEEERHRGLYWWRTWRMIVGEAPKCEGISEREARRDPAGARWRVTWSRTEGSSDRQTLPVGADLKLRDGCKLGDQLTFPLDALEAVAAITNVYQLPTIEACVQALKRALKRGLLPKGTLPNL